MYGQYPSEAQEGRRAHDQGSCDVMKDVLEVRDRWASQGKKVAVAPGVKSRNGRLVFGAAQ